MGGAFNLSFCPWAPLSCSRAYQWFPVSLIADSRGRLESTSLFWLYLAVGGDSLMIEGPYRWVVLKRAPLLNSHTASASMNR